MLSCPQDASVRTCGKNARGFKIFILSIFSLFQLTLRSGKIRYPHLTIIRHMWAKSYCDPIRPSLWFWRSKFWIETILLWTVNFHPGRALTYTVLTPPYCHIVLIATHFAWRNSWITGPWVHGIWKRQRRPRNPVYRGWGAQAKFVVYPVTDQGKIWSSLLRGLRRPTLGESSCC